MKLAHHTLERSLAAYAMGALPADDRETVEHHVVDCTSCLGDVARLKNLAARLSELERERARVWERVLHSIAASDVRRHSDVVDVVRAAADGDSTACGRLVHRYAPLVWAVARGCGLSPTAAAEVSQTTWLRLADHLHRIGHNESVGEWLAMAARHESVRKLRRRDEGHPVADVGANSGQDTGVVEPARGVLDDENAGADLWEAFTCLPPECKLLLRMLIVHPTPSYSEVSAALDIPPSSVGPTRSRCLKRLRQSLGS